MGNRWDGLSVGVQRSNDRERRLARFPDQERTPRCEEFTEGASYAQIGGRAVKAVFSVIIDMQLPCPPSVGEIR